MEIDRCWGVAENGDVVELAVASCLTGQLIDRWPPVGLVRTTKPAEPVVARFGLSNEALIVPRDDELGDAPPPSAWDHLESELTLFTVQRLTPRVAVHSAVIAWHGSVLLVPGSSGAGKSTLSVAAFEMGATVLSDEYALIDPATGLVEGWPRPVRILGDDGSIDRLDLAVPSAPMPVGLIAVVAHETGPDASWTPISAAEATVELLAHTICARTRPDAALDAMLSVVRSAPAVAGSRGEAGPAIAGLLDRLDQCADRDAEGGASGPVVTEER